MALAHRQARERTQHQGRQQSGDGSGSFGLHSHDCCLSRMHGVRVRRIDRELIGASQSELSTKSENLNTSLLGPHFTYLQHAGREFGRNVAQGASTWQTKAISETVLSEVEVLFMRDVTDR
jgi:hypothetical protein